MESGAKQKSRHEHKIKAKQKEDRNIQIQKQNEHIVVDNVIGASEQINRLGQSKWEKIHSGYGKMLKKRTKNEPAQALSKQEAIPEQQTRKLKRSKNTETTYREKARVIQESGNPTTTY